ncbi:MAG: aminopeptidase P family protein [Hyphomicrobiales bacterium]|nr:aminopeptidase P family protein [Hyphomicrobiales bacterium]
MDERLLNPISTTELERRWAATRKLMVERKIDALVLQNNNDWLGGYVRWFTDTPLSNGYPRSVIFPAGDLMTVVDMGARGGRRKLDGGDPVNRGVGEMIFTPAFTSVAYTDEYQAELVAEELKRRHYRTVGWVGSGAMPHKFVARIERDLFGRSTFVDATEWVDRLKAIKSEEEKELIRKCAAMQDEIFTRVLGKVRPGMTDNDITALAQYEGRLLGSEQGLFLGSSAPLGQASRFFDRHQQARTVNAGEHFSILIENNGPGGMYTEIARTIVLGKASNELVDGFESMKEAQAHTLGLLKPGASCAEIAARHDEYMRGRGLPGELRLYAHGQGYDLVERPLIRADETMKLEEHMNLAVHPGYETSSIFAVICDNYLIEAGGPGECLHKTPKRIFEV